MIPFLHFYSILGWEFNLRIELSVVEALTLDPRLVKISRSPKSQPKKASDAPKKKGV